MNNVDRMRERYDMAANIFTATGLASLGMAIITAAAGGIEALWLLCAAGVLFALATLSSHVSRYLENRAEDRTLSLKDLANRDRLREWEERKRRHMAQQEELTRQRVKEKWVIINYFPHEPAHVYGTFDSEEAARAYAESHGMATGGNSCEICFLYDVEED